MTGQADGDAVAAVLGLTRRTLHRRLAEHGTGLQRLLDETRFEVAKQLLGETNLSALHIGAILGFAEAGVFTRAFSRWGGVTPSRWRAREAAAHGYGSGASAASTGTATSMTSRP